MEDQEGYPVENTTNRVRITVTGANRLLGLDNGDSTDFVWYIPRLFSGKLLAILGSTLEPGTIQGGVLPRASSQQAIFRSRLPESRQGRSAQMESDERPCVTGHSQEVPLRKIELVAEGGRRLTPQMRDTVVRAKLHPANTSYRELQWRVVSAGGIDSELAALHRGPEQVRLEAAGDGKSACAA